jgi:ubiquitin C-terminal hydrolase
MTYKIINNNNNCYLNVILQIFLNSKFTKNLLLNSNYLIIKDNIINPNKILNLIKSNININTQNDAQEAFIYLIDKLPFLNNNCEGKIKSEYMCHNCNKIKTKFELFTTLILYEKSMEKSINKYLKSNTCYINCDICKVSSEITIKYSISKINNLLIFFNILKLKIEVIMNINFNNDKYNLIGYIKHIGNFNSGHYIYYDVINNLEIDDLNIKKFNSHNLNNIYLLIYEKL